MNGGKMRSEKRRPSHGTWLSCSPRKPPTALTTGPLPRDISPTASMTPSPHRIHTKLKPRSASTDSTRWVCRAGCTSTYRMALPSQMRGRSEGRCAAVRLAYRASITQARDAGCIKFASRNGGLVRSRGERGRECAASPGWLLDAEIIPPHIGLVVIAPVGHVIERLPPRQRRGENRAFDLALPGVEVRGQPRARIIHEVDATHAAEIGCGVEREPRRHQVVGVVAWVAARVGIGDVDLHEPRAVALERHD